MRNIMVLLAFLFFVTGCASGGTNAGGDGVREVDVRVTESSAQKEAGPDDVVCTREHKVGSNFPRTVCRTRAEREASRRDAENVTRAQQGRNAAGRMDSSRMGGN